MVIFLILALLLINCSISVISETKIIVLCRDTVMEGAEALGVPQIISVIKGDNNKKQ